MDDTPTMRVPAPVGDDPRTPQPAGSPVGADTHSWQHVLVDCDGDAWLQSGSYWATSHQSYTRDQIDSQYGPTTEYVLVPPDDLDALLAQARRCREHPA